MQRLEPALRKVARELDVPEATRRELLLEMAADLEAVFDHHRSRGLSEEDAARKAEEAVLGSSQVIRRLAELHRSPWRRWPEEVGGLLTRGAGPVLIAAGVLPMLVLAGGVSAWTLAGGSSPMVWPIVAVAMLLLCLLVTELGRIIGGHPLHPRTAPALAILSAAAPALGVLAVAVGVRASAVELTAGADQAAVASRIAEDGAALLMGLLTGIVGLLSWFALVSRESRRVDREVEALLSRGSRVHRTVDPRPAKATILPLVRRRQ